MRFAMLALLVSLPLSLAGCGARRPTIDQLTYFESVQLVDAEQARWDTIAEQIDGKRSSAEAAELQASLDRQSERLQRAFDVRDAAWAREAKLVAR